LLFFKLEKKMSTGGSQFWFAFIVTLVSIAATSLIGFGVWLNKAWMRRKSSLKDVGEETNSSFVYKNKLPTDKDKGRKDICVLLIDPQNSFCDPKGSLSVPGAADDCVRFAAAFTKHLAKVNEVFVTLDTHQKYHIAHALFWVNNKKEHPAPFTIITAADVDKGIWKAQNPQHQTWAVNYVHELESGGRFQLVIWPDHCLVGSSGHCVYEPLMAALLKWEQTKQSSVSYVLKGNNAFTEHYSAIKAEVKVEEDPITHTNFVLIEKLKKFDRIVVAGQALSHCVNFTVRDLVEQLSPEERSKVWVAKDASSSVKGFEKAGDTFVIDMKKLGVKFVKSAEAFS
jgi:nicotinamidase/pyrazinamidase